MTQIVFATLIFASVASLVLALGSLVRARPFKRRLARLADGTSADVSKNADGEGVLTSESKSLLVRLLAPLAGKAAQRRDASRDPMRLRLIQAGYRSESAITIFMGSRIALALLLPGLMLFSPLAWSFTELQLAVLLCIAAGVGVIGPGYWVDKRRKARQEMMILGLPDGLDMMVVCVEAGLGINASLVRIADEFVLSNPIMSAEFELVTLEIRTGKSNTEALRALADRGKGQLLPRPVGGLDRLDQLHGELFFVVAIVAEVTLVGGVVDGIKSWQHTRLDAPEAVAG